MCLPTRNRDAATNIDPGLFGQESLKVGIIHPGDVEGVVWIGWFHLIFKRCCQQYLPKISLSIFQAAAPITIRTSPMYDNKTLEVPMEGSWAVKSVGKFAGIHGLDHGVITLTNGKVSGGDSHFLYDGTYTQNGNRLEAHVHVKQHAAEGAMPLVIVEGRNDYDLEVTGTRQGNTIMASGFMKGTDRRLEVELTRQRDLPPTA